MMMIGQLSNCNFKAKIASFEVCIQNPNFEGLLLRLLSKKKITHCQNISHQLSKLWPDYEKPASTYDLNSRISLNDLIRIAKHDREIEKLLNLIGLLNLK